MVNKKTIRTRGKLQFSRYFKQFNEGDTVAITREQSLQPSFPKKYQGRTGTIEDKRGKAYLVKIKDGNKYKQFLIEPIHLKKIKQTKKQDDKE